MLEGQFLKEVSNSSTLDSPLYKLAEKMPNKEMDIAKLDKPIVKEISNDEKVVDKLKIKEETGWSDKIIDSIGSMEEYEIYKNAGLVEAEVNGQPCLVKKELDFKQEDNMGRTNEERMRNGLAPLDKEGRPIELHHIGQKTDSPLAELTLQEHRGKGNDTILHDKKKESEIDREKFAIQRSEHWENRV